MKRIRVSAPAERDLDDIWRYIVKKSGSLDVAGSSG
jgi:plasmid stabilization system protein ParE